jgi:hypothetical protein
MGGLRDNNMDWKRGSDFIPAPMLSGVLADASLGSGTGALAEVSTLNTVGLAFSNAGTDAVHHCMNVPKKWSVNHPLGIRIHFTSSTTTDADDFLFTVLHDFKATADDDAIIAAATALDTPIAGVTWGTKAAYSPHVSTRGIIASNWLPRSTVDAGAYLSLLITGTTIDTAISLLSVEIDYMPHVCHGAGSSVIGGLTALNG